MQNHRIDELADRSADRLAEDDHGSSLEPRRQAKERIWHELDAMRAEDKILVLTDEEERLLRSFRRFRCGGKPGAVFKWQTHPEAGAIAVPADPVLVQDPQDVSETPTAPATKSQR